MTIQPLPCGCTVTVEHPKNPAPMGTLQNPLTVKQCATHAAISTSELAGIGGDLASIASSLEQLARCTEGPQFRVISEKG